ncbi:hypothetical protein [Aeromonas rivipollensis]|uniref:hypothetical protein n=1 Tax=Aeromonas rivipollensis TaxID=948519 RepID=UPI00373AEC73
MRDINNGGDINVNGDLVINDHSQNTVGKLLINCTNEELFQERPFRQENLRLERNRKMKRGALLLSFAVILFIISAVWGYIAGKSDFATLALNIGALVVGFATVKGVMEPNNFEIQEQNAINLINMILKSRRVE